MKNFKNLSLLLFTITLMTSCLAQKQSPLQEHLHRKWMLISFKNETKEDLMKLEAYMDLSRQEKNQKHYSANMGCNRLIFTATFKNGVSRFGGVVSTRMFCEGKMKLETAFSQELPNMIKYKIEGHFLTLSNPKGEEMKFVAADWD